jgi:AcrR family transcriptional regulator
MLEQPGGERITTAALASRLGVSEAALYRHFASKAQMFEGLIEFIEQSVFTLINQITADALGDGKHQVARIVAMLLQFGEKNPGMVRVMVGDALVFENERLSQRMNLFFDKIESVLRQSLRDGALGEGSSTPGADALAGFPISCKIARSFVLFSGVHVHYRTLSARRRAPAAARTFRAKAGREGRALLKGQQTKAAIVDAALSAGHADRAGGA